MVDPLWLRGGPLLGYNVTEALGSSGPSYLDGECLGDNH